MSMSILYIEGDQAPEVISCYQGKKTLLEKAPTLLAHIQKAGPGMLID